MVEVLSFGKIVGWARNLYSITMILFSSMQCIKSDLEGLFATIGRMDNGLT